jgi:asparagine synthase (glutamine-hydrolysing)
MCGIAGALLTGASTDAATLRRQVSMMAAAIAHRGPDGRGAWADPAAGIALAHARLSILDLSPTGAQPMCSPDERLVIVFNGEVYNHLALRRELEGRGRRLHGTSDTEVFLAAIDQWGLESAVERAVGMFAFALWDRDARALHLVRDRLGEKPLYYGWVGATFLFGSELRALRAHPAWCGQIDRAVLDQYFRFGYVPPPLCIYSGCAQVTPGTILTLDPRAGAGAEPKVTTYWSLADVARRGAEAPFPGGLLEASEELERMLARSIREQMVADVPVGCFLSGGIDSSTIAALMQREAAGRIRTFSIGFSDAAYDEAPYARAVARHLGTDHTELTVTPAAALGVIPALPQIYDEPFADSSQVPMVLLARMAREHVTVALTGDGGDEVFCGYNSHVRLNQIWRRIRHVPLVIRQLGARAIALVPVGAYDAVLRRARVGVLGDQVQKLGRMIREDSPESMYRSLVTVWEPGSIVRDGGSSPPLAFDAPGRWPPSDDLLSRLLFLGSVTSLPGDMLVKVDRAAMASGLEARAPLLDHRTVEFAWSLPTALKSSGGLGKLPLRHLLNRLVPRSLVDRPKTGFSIPIDEWLKGPLRDWAESLLSPEQLAREGMLRSEPIRAKWKEHLDGRRKWQQHLWAVLMFEAWLQDSSKPRTRAA